MNTLDDLRRTLDAHAGDVHDDVVHARTAAVRGRAAAVRRRRAAGVAATAALAVVGAVGIPQLLGNPGVGPAAAPDTRSALGWTYRFDDMVHEDGDEVRIRLDESPYPRLISWATDGTDQAVEVRTGWPGRFTSTRGDFEDHVQVPAGYDGIVRVTGAAGLSVATYTLDTERSPDGVGSGPRTFREDVAGLDFLGAAAGRPGQASIEFDLVPRESTTWIGYYCDQAPKGTRLNVNWVDARSSVVFGGCDDAPASFDPGGSPGLGLDPGRRAGTPQTLRMWLTRGGEPVADGEFPDLRLGLGAYTASGDPTPMLGFEEWEQREYAGHVYQLVEIRTAGPGEVPRITVPEDGDFMVGDAFRGPGKIRVRLEADGRPVEGTTTFNVGGSVGSGEKPVPAGSVVTLEFGRTLDTVAASGLALYERVD